MNTEENLYSTKQLEIIELYKKLYQDRGFIHLTARELDSQHLRKKIYKHFGNLDNFRNIVENLTTYQSAETENDVDVDISKILYKKDCIIKNLRTEKNLLLKQICNQENFYNYIQENIPEIEYNHIHKDIIVNEEVKKGTAVLHLSDLHYGEVVQFGNVVYDCAIAEDRLSTIVSKFCNIVKDYNKAVVFINGDMVNGCIHGEFNRTNEMLIIDTVLRVSKLLSESLILIYESLRGENKTLDVVFTVGNHARTIPGDIYYKNKVKENWEYLLGNLVERELYNTNIQVEVCSTPSIVYYIEDLRFAVTHGDCFKSLSNIRMAAAKFQEMNMSTIGPFDHLIIGHFHTTRIENVLGGKIFVNGAFKDCDEYSVGNLYSISPAEQTCLIVEGNEIKDIKILQA